MGSLTLLGLVLDVHLFSLCERCSLPLPPLDGAGSSSLALCWCASLLLGVWCSFLSSFRCISQTLKCVNMELSTITEQEGREKAAPIAIRGSGEKAPAKRRREKAAPSKREEGRNRHQHQMGEREVTASRSPSPLPSGCVASYPPPCWWCVVSLSPLERWCSHFFFLKNVRIYIQQILNVVALALCVPVR